MEEAGAKAGLMAGCVFGMSLAICTIFSFFRSRELLVEEMAIQLEQIAYPVPEIGNLLKIIMVVAPIAIFLISALFGLLFGLLYHRLYLHNPKLKAMYATLVGLLLGIFFGFTTNIALSRSKTVAICLFLGLLYAVVLLYLHSRYMEAVNLELDQLQMSILEVIKRKKPKFVELLKTIPVDKEELRDELCKLDDLGLIAEDYQNRYLIKDAGKLLLRDQRGIKKTAVVSDSRSVLVFILISYGIMCVTALGIYLAGGLSKIGIFAPLIGAGVMFAPLIASAVVIKYMTYERFTDFGLKRGKLRYYIYALIYPFITLALGLIFVSIFKTADIHFSNIKTMGWSLTMVSLMIAAPFFNIIFAFGEEFGWRGFLQEKLTKRYPLPIALLTIGLIWGFWHAPLILLGYNYPHHPVIGVFLFTVFCVLFGIFLSWLRIRSDSIFPCALAHGAFNAYAGFGLLIAPADELFTVPMGFPAMLAYVVITVLVCLNLRGCK